MIDLLVLLEFYVIYFLVVATAGLGVVAVWIEIAKRHPELVRADPPGEDPVPSWVDPQHINGMRDLLIANGITEHAPRTERHVG